MSEKNVINGLRLWLISSSQTITQLVFPGGQAKYSIYFTGKDGTRKITYPDLICYDDEAIIIGEAKGKHNKKDEEKLVEEMESADFVINVKKLLTSLYKLDFTKHKMIYALINADITPPTNKLLTHIQILDDARVKMS